MRIATALVSLLLASSSFAGTPGEWRRDIEQIVSDIKATHPDPFGDIGERALRRRAAALQRDIESLSEEQRMVGVMALVGSLGDGHSRLEPTAQQFARWYPVRFYEFSDGIFVTGAHQSVRDLAGAHVIRIGGRPATDAARAASTLFGRDNAWDGKERLHAMSNAALMHGLGFAAADGSLEIEIRLGDGRAVRRKLTPIQTQSAVFDWIFRPEYWGAFGEPEEWTSAYTGESVAELRTLDAARPLHLVYRRAFHAQRAPNGDAYYIQVNVMGNTREESLLGFFRRALQEIDKTRPRRVVIDLRYNFGGDGSLIPPILDEFLSRKKSPPWKELYVLTGRRTFSAGVLLLDALIDSMQPTLVGEPAGAPHNSYGDANQFDYAKTGLRMYVSHEQHFNGKSTDMSDAILVDYPAPFSSADYFAGRDPAVDAILSERETRSIEAIALSDGAARATEVYLERERRFAADPSWKRPTEPDLRAIARAVEESGRNEEALEIARLNARINPSEWRTWYNLGNLQMKIGKNADAIESYKRSLALDDPTNFNAERLRKIVAEGGS
jgi:hypothetical protein